MSTAVQRRRGTTAEHATFTGAVGETTVDTTKDTVVVHDGSTAGGFPLLREDLSNLPAGTIDNADVNAAAAIAGTKISPNFGAQNIATTGTCSAARFKTPTDYTVATLPNPGVLGDIARVTDATAPAVGSTVTGGGGAAALVWFNGANWTVIGK